MYGNCFSTYFIFVPIGSGHARQSFRRKRIFKDFLWKYSLIRSGGETESGYKIFSAEVRCRPEYMIYMNFKLTSTSNLLAKFYILILKIIDNLCTMLIIIKHRSATSTLFWKSYII